MKLTDLMQHIEDRGHEWLLRTKGTGYMANVYRKGITQFNTTPKQMKEASNFADGETPKSALITACVEAGLFKVKC